MINDGSKKYFIRDLIFIFSVIAFAVGAGLMIAATAGASASLFLPGAIAAFVGFVPVAAIGIQFHDHFFKKWVWEKYFPCSKKEGQLQEPLQQQDQGERKENDKEEEKSKDEKNENKNIDKQEKQEPKEEKNKSDFNLNSKPIQTDVSKTNKEGVNEKNEIELK